MKPTPHDILTDVVSRLASQPDVAAYFREQGITGWRCLAGECPVANYVRRETGFDRVTAFDHVTTYEAAADEDSECIEHSVTTPPNVFAFIEQFDRGDFPDLATI